MLGLASRDLQRALSLLEVMMVAGLLLVSTGLTLVMAMKLEERTNHAADEDKLQNTRNVFQPTESLDRHLPK